MSEREMAPDPKDIGAIIPKAADAEERQVDSTRDSSSVLEKTLAIREQDQPFKDAENERLRHENAELKQRIDMREKYALQVYELCCCWLFVIMALLFLQGFTRDDTALQFHLSDGVLIAVTTSTTVAILGLLAIVIGDLFYKGKRN